MTDLAVHVLEPNRRLDAIDRKILTVLQDQASLSVVDRRLGGAVLDPVLEAHPAAEADG